MIFHSDDEEGFEGREIVSPPAGGRTESKQAGVVCLSVAPRTASRSEQKSRSREARPRKISVRKFICGQIHFIAAFGTKKERRDIKALATFYVALRWKFLFPRTLLCVTVFADRIGSSAGPFEKVYVLAVFMQTLFLQRLKPISCFFFN